MTDLRTAAQRLLDAIDRALPEAPLCSAFDVVADTAADLRKALAYREDKAQAAFEHWLVEKLLTVTQAQMAHAEAVENLTVKESLTVEPCNKSCAPGYCYCEPIIKPEIKVDNTEPGQTNPWRDAVDHELSTLHMVASDDPRESIRRLIDWHCAVQIDPLVSSAAQELIERGKREALEQPQQEEPVAWRYKGMMGMPWSLSDDGYYVSCKRDKGYTVEPLYTHPPRREWRGLKEWEINDGLDQLPTEDVCSWSFRQGVYFAEKALKERNV
jgi:hypothetical protein